MTLVDLGTYTREPKVVRTGRTVIIIEEFETDKQAAAVAAAAKEVYRGMMEKSSSIVMTERHR
jgi:hypothetical protein